MALLALPAGLGLSRIAGCCEGFRLRVHGGVNWAWLGALMGGEGSLRLRTLLCDVLGIETPLVLAPFGPWDQVVLAAAVSNAGGLGSVGTAVRSVAEMRAQWAQLAELTDRPIAINRAAVRRGRLRGHA